MMNKWIIGINEVLREKDINTIKIEEKENSLYMAIAFDSKGNQISVLSCEIGRDKLNKQLNNILNKGDNDDS